VAWLLDLLPEYRQYPVVQRHPVSAVRTVTTAPADRASSGASASAAATAPDGREASTVTDATTWSADQQPNIPRGSACGTKGSPPSSRGTVITTSNAWRCSANSGQSASMLSTGAVSMSARQAGLPTFRRSGRQRPRACQRAGCPPARSRIAGSGVRLRLQQRFCPVSAVRTERHLADLFCATDVIVGRDRGSSSPAPGGRGGASRCRIAGRGG
jgi:hypothetical protein